MAYKTTVAKSCATRDTALAELWTQLAEMGWTLVDGNFTALTMAYTAVSIANDTFTTAGTVPPDGTPCQLVTTGTAPGGLAVLTQYYIVSRTSTTFKLSATYNGAGINLTSQGTGNHTITESFRVYSSNGEASDKITEYMKIAFFASATLTYFYAAYYYNSTTKALSGTSSPTQPGSITTNQTGFTLWIHGNKDVVVVTIKISTTYYRVLFGHLKSPYTLLTTLTDAASTGAGATLTVGSTNGFEVGSTYQILGATAEGRDELTIASITSATSMTVSNLPRNYSSGSFIGDRPSTFGVSRTAADSVFHMTCPIKVVGLDDTTTYNFGTFIPWFSITNVDPDLSLSKRILQALYFGDMLNNTNSSQSVGLYFDIIVWAISTSGLINEDTFSVGKLDSGTSTGTGNTTSVLNDTGKSWVTNAYAGKSLIITFGTGIGQIKKIASNTATAITLASGWTFSVTPDNTSQYIICSEAYRALWTVNTELALREGY